MRGLIVLCAIVFFVPCVQLSDLKDDEDDAKEPYERPPEIITDASGEINARGMVEKTKELVWITEKDVTSESSSSISSAEQTKHGDKDEEKIFKYLSLLSFNFGTFPCSCEYFGCSCVFDLELPRFHVNFRGGVNLTLDIINYGIHLDIFTEKVILYRTKVTVLDPQPACVMPVATVPLLTFCAQLRDIHVFKGYRGIHTCMDFKVMMTGYDALVLPVVCVEAGFDGVRIIEFRDYLEETVGISQ